MTGTDLAVVEAAHAPDLVSSVQLYGQLAVQIAATEFVPQELRNRPEAALASMLYGRELGLGPMQSLNMIQSIKGRVGLKPEAMRALVRAQGHQIWVKAQSNESITMCGHRREDPAEIVAEVTWTLEDARKAELLRGGGSNWTKYPRAMLAARCTAELCRLHFADVIGGLSYTPEELSEMPSIEAEVVEPDPGQPVDVKQAKGVLMDAIRRQGWPYEQGNRDCPAAVEAVRAWGSREQITVGELRDLVASVGPYREPATQNPAQGAGGESSDGNGFAAPVEDVVMQHGSGEAVDAGASEPEPAPAAEVSGAPESTVSSAAPGPDAVNLSDPDGRPFDAPMSPVRPGEEPFGDEDRSPIGSEAGRTVHVDLGRRGVSKKADQEAFIRCASNGRTAKASELFASEASRCLFFAESVRDGRMALADITAGAREMEAQA